MVVWTSAWLHGAAASDDVVDALQTWAEDHEVRAASDELATRLELPGPQGRPAGAGLLLAALRKAGAARGDLVLPVAGDVRGLDGASPFSQFALRCGEAGVFADAGLGVVPEHVAEGVLRWSVFELGVLPPAEYVPIGEAEHGMASAMREAASTLNDLDIARHRPGVRGEIAEAVSARPQPDWPDDAPQRPLRVLQRAAEVEAILRVASDDAPGGALSSSATRARTDALRPLFDAVRSARCAAVAEMVRVLADRTEQY
ncbi:hypothetical protein FHX42_002074 [Saccharopolyspora lacisalsi]|uniref:Uncharacterized protein n=1 Tax=Halosaccharopolyspora lacisalsi TaxID=1000566 RepID=A0A839DZ10_9PSEU|nr:hypothetical protein [Halosaccharopolyspora lacisalsi]MBA8824727.1 hypothetical protein [Halosaccharopolyspora lacisalsi]